MVYSTIGHRRRIYLEAKANIRRLFLGENGRLLRLCCRQIDKGGQGQLIQYSFDDDVVIHFQTVLYSSVVASWVVTLKDTGSLFIFPFLRLLVRILYP